MKGKYEQATQKLERLKKQQNLNALKQHAHESSLQKQQDKNEKVKEVVKQTPVASETQKAPESKV